MKILALSIMHHRPNAAVPAPTPSTTTVAASGTAGAGATNEEDKRPAAGTATRLALVMDVSSFNFFVRGTISEHVRFALRAVAERTPPATRHSVGMKDNPFRVHSYTRVDGLCGVAVTDIEYPQRAIHTLITRQLQMYEKLYPTWSTLSSDQPVEPVWMMNDLKEWQDPASQDKITKIQKELDEIKEIMSKNIEMVIARGESLDVLMEKSNDLTEQSRRFHRRTTDLTRCCKLF